MSKEDKIKELKIVTDKIAKDYLPEKIILFGSYAWGKPTEDSDFDLMIVKKDKKKGKKGFFEDQMRVRDIIDGELAIDVLIHTPEEIEKRLEMGDFFFRDIMKKGKCLYEKRSK